MHARRPSKLAPRAPGALRSRCAPSLALALALAACGPTPVDGTGGTDVEPTAFGRGVVTIHTDYQSTNVSLVGLDGERLSQSFISSAQQLSWDVAAPSTPSTGADVVLLDRKLSLVTWVDVRTAGIRAQLHADGDGLAQNPWDYLPLSKNKAYVTRYDTRPGQPGGGDVIVIDPERASVTTPITDRIDVAAALPLADGFVAHPARALAVADRAYLTTVIADPQYVYASSHVVAIDTSTDAVVATRELTGLHDCTGIALSPDRTRLAVTCSGDLYANEDHEQAASAVAILALPALDEIARFPAEGRATGPFGFSISFASDTSILVTAFGAASPGSSGDDQDQAVLIDLTTGAAREIHRSAPVAIGAVLCPARIDGATGPSAAPQACFVTDAGEGALLRFPANGADLGSPETFIPDEIVGLPPMYLGQF